jgi:hypothetical protein
MAKPLFSARTVRLVLPLVLFLLLGLQETWPWVLHPGSRISAPIGGDVSSSIAKFGVLAREHIVPWLPARMHTVGWPLGLKTTPGLDAVSILSSTPLWVGSMLVGPIAAHGVAAVLAYFLTATVTFLFIRRVTGSAMAGTVAGFAYGFFPHLSGMVYADITYAHMWLFILPLWALWELVRAPSRRRGLVAGGAVVLAMFWTPYYAEHAVVIFVSALIALGLLARRLELPRRLLCWALVPVAVAGAVQVFIGRLTGFEDQPARPVSDVYEQSAHPLMYVMPGYASSWTRAGARVTDWSYRTLVDLVPRAHQTNLYIGLSVLALAVVAVVRVVVPWWRTRSPDLAGPATAAVIGGAAVIGAFVFSLPPRVSLVGISVPLPELAVHHLVPGLRAGQRFVMPLMGGMSVLAGVGAWSLLRRLSARWAAVVGIALCATVIIDLSTSFPGAWGPSAPATPAIRALAKAPPGPTLEATPYGFIGRDPQRACQLQEFHGHPLFNTCAIQQVPLPLLRIASLPACDAIDELRDRGLRYIIEEPMRPDVVGDCLRDDPRLRNARTLAVDGSYRVWVVATEPHAPRGRNKHASHR